MGISTLHGPHQVAQKFSRTALPRRSESLMGLPDASCAVKSGAILRSSGFTYVELGAGLEALPIRNSRTLLDSWTQADTQRCAIARVTGNAIKGRPRATTPAAAQ